MTTPVVINGATYQQPTQGTPSPWGADQAEIVVALVAACLQKTGGSFTLSADADFGGSFGLKSAYFVSRSSNAATAGPIRLANNEGVNWRNAANGADIALKIDASDKLDFDGSAVSSTEFGYLSGVTSSIQDQLDAAGGELVLEEPATGVTSGIKTELQWGIGESQFGYVCRMHSDGKMRYADADAIATANVIAMATGELVEDESGDFLLMGLATFNSWTWTVGGILYLSTTGTEMTQTPPSGSGDVVQVVGVALSATTIYFNPSLAQVEVA